MRLTELSAQAWRATYILDEEGQRTALDPVPAGEPWTDVSAVTFQCPRCPRVPGQAHTIVCSVTGDVEPEARRFHVDGRDAKDVTLIGVDGDDEIRVAGFCGCRVIVRAGEVHTL